MESGDVAGVDDLEQCIAEGGAICSIRETYSVPSLWQCGKTASIPSVCENSSTISNDADVDDLTRMIADPALVC